MRGMTNLGIESQMRGEIAKEYHLIMVLARALEGTGMPGSGGEQTCGDDTSSSVCWV